MSASGSGSGSGLMSQSQQQLRIKHEKPDNQDQHSSSTNPICVISSWHSNTPSELAQESQDSTSNSNPVPEADDGDGDGESWPTRRNLYNINYAESDGDGGGGDGQSGFGIGRRRRRKRGQGLRQAYHEPKLEEQYWISCRFCTRTFSESGGISKVMDHEETEHPEQVESDKKLPFYKIFKLKLMNVEAFPEHPGREKLFAKYPIPGTWPPKPELNSDPDGQKVRGRGRGRGSGRWRNYSYSPTDLICPHCKQKFKYPSMCQQHQQYCTQRPGRSPAFRSRCGPRPMVKTCQNCGQACVGSAGLQLHYKTCPNRIRKPRTGTTKICQHCGQTCVGTAGLQIHYKTCPLRIRRRRAKTTKICKDCGQTCLGSAGLHAHYKMCPLRSRRRRSQSTASGNAGGGSCPDCHRTFRFPSEFANHMRSACRFSPTTRCPPTLTLTICPYCQRNYKFPSALWQHLKACSLARAAAKEMGLFGTDFPASLLPTLGVNTSLVPRTPSKVPVEPTTIPPANVVKQRCTLKYMTCELCGHVSLSRMGLMNHRNIVHKITTPPIESNTTSDQIVELATNSSGTRLLPSQEEQLEQNAASTNETITSNTDEMRPNPKVYKCRQCFRPFPDRFKMLQHERIHSADKPFKCNACPATFARTASRNKHIKLLHRGENGTSSDNSKIPQEEDLKCRYCQRVCFNIAALTIHERSHGGDRGRRNGSSSGVVASSSTVGPRKSGERSKECRFCHLVLANAAGKTMHERYVHRAQLEALEKTDSGTDEARALSLVKTEMGNDQDDPNTSVFNSGPDLVIVSQEQEFFLENGEGENDVDPLFLPDSEPQPGPEGEDEVQEILRTTSLNVPYLMTEAVKKALNTGPRGDSLTLNYEPSTNNAFTTDDIPEATPASTPFQEQEEIIGLDSEAILPTTSADEEVGTSARTEESQSQPQRHAFIPVPFGFATSKRNMYKCVKCGVLFPSRHTVAEHPCTP